MRREAVLRILAEHRAAPHDRYSVGSLSLFGPVARDKVPADSDIDLLVELTEPVGLFHLIELQLHLEDLFDQSVDLITAGGLKHHLREQILREAILAAQRMTAPY